MGSDICFFIQARLGSTRLPGKVLLPFYRQQSILDLMINKLQRISSNIIIVTSQEFANKALDDVALKHGVECFHGSEEDVLRRFIDAAEKYNIEKIIRVCSDNPFLEIDSIRRLVDYVTRNPFYEYVSFDIQGIPSIKTHYGFWTEYVTLSALKKVVTLTDEALYHEHVTNYIYTNPSYFLINWLQGPEKLSSYPDIRLTIDTKDDFENAQIIYSNLSCVDEFPSIDEVVDYLDRHPSWYETMKIQIRKNTK